MVPSRNPFAAVADAVDRRFPGHSWRAFCRWANDRGYDVQPHTVTRARQGTAHWDLAWTEALGDFLLMEHPGRELDVAEALVANLLDRWGCRAVNDDVVAEGAAAELHRLAVACIELTARYTAAHSPASLGGTEVVADELRHIVDGARDLRPAIDAFITAADAELAPRAASR